MECNFSFDSLPVTKYAPIFVVAYRRPTHLRKSIEALAGNDEARESILFVGSDGPKAGDELLVAEVRSVVEEYQDKGRFLQVVLLKSETNTNVWFSINCRIAVLKYYDMVITFEDDVVVDQYFLRYMNEALQKYKHRDDIFAVSGYIPSLVKPLPVKNDVFLSSKFTNYGFGIWVRSDFEKAIARGKNAYLLLLKDTKLFRKLLARFPKVATFSLRQMMHAPKTAIIRGDALLALHMTINDQYCLFPKFTMTRNIGFDGSGTHSPNASTHDVQLTGFIPQLLDDLKYNPIHDQPLFDFYDGKHQSWIRRVVNWVNYFTDKALLRLKFNNKV